ncbi:hypothetical protein BDW59DRAFT_137042 [Aspergillus cavernicola]|uniref:DUF1917-domain-containing protein n=1 Tax=Aspergillus cavernicola TaxID=176166 RepID=A0ABR4J599_9EURO
MAEDVFSDDSSFYGDEEETCQLESQASEYDPEPYWTTIHPHLLSTVQSQQQERNQPSKELKMASSPMDIDTDAPQILPRNQPGENESSADFLARLPPSTTKAETVGAWIYVYTPYIRGLKDDVPEFKRKGREALSAFEIEEASLRYENDRKGGSTVAMSRKVVPLKLQLEEHIFTLARETNCVTGKWMLFISADRVDCYWSAVADATRCGELGIAAKVATDDKEDNRHRLIAVYTRDHADLEDIKRVLRRLMELNLVRKSEQPIYYKHDALTYLEIMSKNRYGLKATAFSSADVLAGKI